MAKQSKLLTEVELELMNILWKLKEATVREVLAELPEERQMAYTSASTIVRILEQKNIVESRKQGKAHIYRPLLAKPEFEKKAVGHVVDEVFSGSRAEMVKCLFSSTAMSEEEKTSLKQMIAEL